MQEHYNIEIDNLRLLQSRSWIWLEHRVIGLLTTTSRLQRVLEKERQEADNV